MSLKLVNAKPGLGYSPNSGPPVGGWKNTPGTTFYGQPIQTILPRGFGYPLTNRYNVPYPISMGRGNTPGGTGGVILQGMPNFQSWWGGFGTKKCKRFSFKNRRSSLKKKKKVKKCKRKSTRYI